MCRGRAGCLRAGRVDLLVRDPGDFRAIDGLAFELGRSVRPIVEPEARLWRLMLNRYGIQRHLRGISLQARSPEAGPRAASPAEFPRSPALAPPGSELVWLDGERRATYPL